MKKLLCFISVLLISIPLWCDIVDLFHPSVSYSEIAMFSFERIRGPYNYLELPRKIGKKGDSQYMYSGDVYFFYGERRTKLYSFDIANMIGYMIDGDAFTASAIGSQAYRKSNILGIPNLFDESGNISQSYVREDAVNKVIFTSKDGSISITFQDYGTHALKRVEKEGKLLFSHWISHFRKMDGYRIPTKEVFHFSEFGYVDTFIFKETMIEGQIGEEYGPYSADRLIELGNLIIQGGSND